VTPCDLGRGREVRLSAVRPPRGGGRKTERLAKGHGGDVLELRKQVVDQAGEVEELAATHDTQSRGQVVREQAVDALGLRVSPEGSVSVYWPGDHPVDDGTETGARSDATTTTRRGRDRIEGVRTGLVRRK